ncbi:multidrug efflux RND transporter permease subunit [Methylobacterium mesophilicum]|uniref:efflux RND transporter permease subunit n=1 Tax=unclassified Methylobacterium TaxID=2615210 RepID=UPI0006F2E6D1|nr:MULTISPECIES: efflux RND transporter permease subunit [unclassified Methylobacterium]KQP07891.1 acriflavine resistance protein B [Methylobacterium sp. Leaf99]TXM65930.1 multidrug efflux RND transporter permease subunit [Methylobacterium sp. WL120]
MTRFFIERPIFAWAISIFIMLVGAISIAFLPVSQYPDVAPVTIQVTAVYPGAPPERLYDGVTRIIEEELNGIPGLMYFESTSDTSGQAQIMASFAPGSDPSKSTVAVQNRIKRIEARLPRAVTQQGVIVEEASTSFLQFVVVSSRDGSLSESDLGDLAARRILGELRRVPGVGRAILFSSEKALRIWIDPMKLVGFNMTPGDVTTAVGAQNAQVASGLVGAQPAKQGQRIAASVLVKGQLTTVAEFEEIVLRANPDGSLVRLRDVAEVELAGQSYTMQTRLDGRPAAGIGIQLAPGGNALAAATGVKDKIAQLQRTLPANVSVTVPYDTTPFVEVSIRKVLMTLAEAMALVFAVMFLFLQNVRYTVIPTIVVPVALLGTCGALLAAGFSINVLTMFGMVLAIGILVDDAIVVVENVERIMSEEGLSPREATRKAMGQITGAIIGITSVLIAVFVPLAFFPGSVGVIYRQFAVSMATSIAFSAFLALSLTPALCATLLKPVEAGHGHANKGGFFGWFNRRFHSGTLAYRAGVAGMLRRPVRSLLVYAALVAALGWGYVRMPSSFLPIEDQGYVIVDAQTPPESATGRTLDVAERIEEHFEAEPAVAARVTLLGFGFSGQGQNAAITFVTLKDWKERGPKDGAGAISARANAVLGGLPDAIAMALSPPAIEALGNSSGFAFRLQDKAQQGYAALAAARDQLLKAASQSPVLAGVYVEGLPTAPQIELSLDRQKASALGVTFADINDALSTSLGSAYVNDFPNQARMQRVIVQAEAGRRMKAEDLLDLHVRNAKGQMVPLQSFASIAWTMGPAQVVGFNGYPSIKISGSAAPGFASGDAMAEMERLAGQLPAGFDYAWTGQSLQEKLSGSQAVYLLALALFCVFLCLAALYESWSIPLAVLLVVPTGVVGAVFAMLLRDMPNDVYFKVGLITVIGLTAKNAILIIEVAKELVAQGRPVREAALEACELRFRPIVMTSFAFILGVVPLAVATGASMNSQRAIGTGVLGGMITATVLAVFVTPLFYVLIASAFRGRPRATSPRAADETMSLPSNIDMTRGVR